MSSPAFNVWLRNEIARRGVSVRAFARLAGVHFTSIQRLLSGDSVPQAYTLGRIAKALGISYEDIRIIASDPT